jgi:uncharacterized protein (TIGR02246 family)
MMRIAAAVLCLGLGAISMATKAPAQTPAPSPPQAPPAEIIRFFHDWFTAVEAGDPDGILALVDMDFVVKWPVGRPISDREQLRAALAKMQQSFRQTVQWEVVEARIAGEWAWARVNERATHLPKSGSEARILEGSHLAILRKAGKRWLLHRDYGSLNKMPDAAP